MKKPLHVIEKALETAKRPWILSSFGKDSMAVIDLCSQFGIRDVLYLEDRDEIVDEKHILRTIDRYHLRLQPMNSGRAILYFIDGAPFLLGFPFVNESVMIPIPTNVDPYVEGETFTCVDDRLRAYHGKPVASGADLLFSGFKIADWESNTCRIAVDRFGPEAKGALRDSYRPVMELPFGVRQCTPLLDWSHDDVWDYLEENNVEVSPLMYDGRKKRPHLNPVCYRCHDPGGPATVTCPKAGATLTNLAHFTGDHGILQLHRIGILSTEEAAGFLRSATHGL